LQTKLDELQARIDGIQTEREKIIKEIPASLLKRYDALRERRQGVAVVEAKAGSCLGCYMGLPPQMYNNLLKVSELVTCPHCQRVLFVRQDG
jgi:predicted  nucleic acid-binding Zn-ribbon protein